VRAGFTCILSDSWEVVYMSFFYEVIRVLFHLNASLRKRLCLFSSSKPRMKQKKALDKEWAVNWQRAIRSTVKVVASMIPHILP